MANTAAAYALRPPVGCTITPIPERDDDAVKPSTLAKLAALEPCDDDEVDLPAPTLLMTEQELLIIEAKAQAVEQAHADLVAADQALARAQHLARAIPALKQAAGVAAAAGFSGKKLDVAAAQKAAAELVEAEAAAAAVPVLLDEQARAKNAAHEAWGSLRGNAQAAMRNALIRQAGEYQRLSRELARVAGHLRASVELLNDPVLLNELHVAFLPGLSVPAAPASLLERAAWQGVAELSFKPLMVHVQHPSVTAHVAAARGWLVNQLQGAVPGLPVQRLMK